jgi:phage host-nuclease inhibitor protein Gam
MKTLISNLSKRLFGLLKTEPIKDQAELLQVCTGYAVTKLQHTTLSAQRDAEALAVAERYEQDLLQLTAEMKHHFKRIKAWAVAHKADPEVFRGKQTFIIGGHELKFHEGTGKVVFADELTDEDVVERILALPTSLAESDLPVEDYGIEQQQELLAMLAENEKLRDALLRVKAELDKKAVARLWRQSESDSVARMRLVDLGLDFVKETSFELVVANVELPDLTQKEAA